MPATVVTSPDSGSRRLRAWLTVSATTTAPSGSRASPCGSWKRARPGGPSTRPRSPLPNRLRAVSPSSASSTTWCRVVSVTRNVPDGSRSTLPGKRSAVGSGSGGAYGRPPRRSVPFAACSASSSVTSRSISGTCPSPEYVATTYPSGSTTTSVGHAFTAYCVHVVSSGSSRTGCATAYRSTASATAACSASCGNFGECTPITTSVSRCRSSSSRSSSTTCRQLMQANVQKSSSTTRPRRPARVCRAPPVLSQPPFPASSGARTRAERRTGERRRRPYVQRATGEAGRGGRGLRPSG